MHLPLVLLLALTTVAVPLAAPARPSHAAVGAAHTVSLNGDVWQFRAVQMPFFGWEQQDTPLNRQFIRDAVTAVPAAEWATWRDVRVPMAWNSVNEFDFPSWWHYVHKGEYRRTFDVPAAFAGNRVTLHFEGVNWKAWVYVNGTLVHAEGFEGTDFTHEYALTPFDVDITGLVTPGSTGNEVRVVVQDITANFIGPSPAEHSVVRYHMGIRGEYWNQSDGGSPRQYHELKSGIFKDVTLLAVPDVHVEDVFVRPDRVTNRITAEVTIRNAGAVSRTVTVANHVTDAAGATALTFAGTPTQTLAPGARTTVVVTQPWSGYRLWWPHDPVLYRLVTTLRSGSTTVAQNSERFGVRDVKAVSSADPAVRGVYVNGVRTALFGESIETNLQGTGVSGLQEDGLTFNGNWALTRSYFAHVIDVARAMNINVLRIHRGWAMSKELVEVADEKGMMLIAENPVTHPRWEHRVAAEHYPNAIRTLLGIARHYRNHPSIVMWSISNEMSVYNADITAGMKTGYGGDGPANPDIQLVSADAETAEVKSDGYLGGYLTSTTPKTWFTYEENASYVKLGNDARRASVVDSLRIFRQQRMSLGYDAKVMLAFYNVQKVFALPSGASPPRPAKVAIPWTASEIAGPGYHAKYLWQSIMNPYADPPTTNYMAGYAPSSQELWKDSYAPVAVFDKGWVDGAMTGPGLTAAYGPQRTFVVFNSDLRDPSTSVTVTWTLVDAADGSTVRSGALTRTVPAGGLLSVPVDTGTAPTGDVILRLSAAKSGTVAFEESLTFGTATLPPAPTQPAPGGDVIVLDNGRPGTATSGLGVSTAVAGTYGPSVAQTAAAGPGDFARFTPWVGTAGSYDIHLHVPAGLSGTQRVNVVRDDGGQRQSTVTVDLGTPGWVRLPGSPYRMGAGPASNYVELVPGGTAPGLVADAVAYQRLTTGTTALGVDQSRVPANGATWEYLGRYSCAAGADCAVTLTNAANGRVIADAVQFRGAGTTVTVDEQQTVRSGRWVNAAKPGSVGGDIYYADPATPATATITYRPQLPETALYDVYLTWDANNGNQRATDVPVTVTGARPWNVVDDDLDDSAAWSTVGGGGTATWSGGGVRFVDDSTTAYHALTRTGFTPVDGPFTYEFTARTHAGRAEVAVRGGAYYVRVVLNHGTAGSVTDNYTNPARTVTLDTTVTRTYRVVVHAGGTYDLYVDGVLRWSGAASKGTGTNILKIGSEPATTADLTVDAVRVATGEHPH